MRYSGTMDKHHNSVTLLNVRVDDVTMDEAINNIIAFLQDGQAHQIATVNPEFVMAAQQNNAFLHVLQQADLAVPDGIGMNFAARWTGQTLQSRVPGVELCERLAALSASDGYKIFLLGAAPGVAETAASVLQQRYPGVTIAGCFAGSPHSADEPMIQERILRAVPDILLVAYGAPAQDLWIARNQPILRIPVAIGVGGAFDYISGNVPRAPTWLRRLGFEWLYRLARQPWRWPRIWTAVVRFPIAIWRSKHYVN